MRAAPFFVSVLVLPACGQASPEKASPEQGTPAAAAAGPVVLEDRPVTIEWHDMQTSLTARVPKGWRESSPGSFQPPAELPSADDPHLGYSFGNRSCDGECDDGDIAQNMAEMWAKHADALKKPFYNTGDPALDAVVLNVEVLEDAALPDGRVFAARVTRPAGFTQHAQVERLDARCVRHRKGDDFYVMARVYVPFREEARLWPALLEACKTAWYP